MFIRVVKGPPPLPERVELGQHRIQRQILLNFSFRGRQPKARNVWCLQAEGYEPAQRSIRNVGFFEVSCSPDVDSYIKLLENRFKDYLPRLSSGSFNRADVGRELYDFLAVHYVRSLGCRSQIQHMVGEFWRNSMLSQPQAELEYVRLSSYQDIRVFQQLVASVASVLTHYLVAPVVINGSRPFITANKVMNAAVVESENRQTLVWFPLSPSTGMLLESPANGKQLLGPFAVDRRLGRVTPAKVRESPLLLCKEPVPEDGSEAFFNVLNGMMVRGSTEIYAADRSLIDAALQSPEGPTGFRYKALADCGVDGAPDRFPA